MRRRRLPSTGPAPRKTAIASVMAALSGWPGLPMVLVALLPTAPAYAQQRVAPQALPSGLVQKSGTALQYSAPVLDAKTGRTTATLTQTDAANIATWDRFDIGAAARLNIVQPSATAVLLNKVNGGAFENKTVIDGVLHANGRVYLYNPNGIVFGKGGAVDTATLIASSLKFDEQRVMLGLLQPGVSPVLAADPLLGRVPGAVVVEGDAGSRATVSALAGGLVMLAAPSVRNSGTVQAPDGQVILAAGSKVYLAAPQVTQTGTSLRGLLVEVSNDDLARLPTGAERIAENTASGQVEVGHGNATMIGYAVNQSGLVSATTSVNLNGSIYLLARDQTTKLTDNSELQPGRSGPLVLGPGSTTQVLPDLADTGTLTASATFNRSEVKLDGANIQLQAQARILAEGGKVGLTARRIDPTGTADLIDPRSDLYRVDLADGSQIDVSGARRSQLAMESNVITVELRGTELADNVVLRNSPLYASKVQIDVRKGTPVANVQGWLDLVGHGLGEVNAAGGKLSISADSAIVQRAGSRLQVDGGWVDYLPGQVNTTQLQIDDKRVDIGAASAGVAYTAAVKLPDSAATFEAGYRQGAAAGSVTLNAPIVVLQGALSGKAEAGRLQRDPTAANYPLGGQLQIGNFVADTNSSFSGKASTSADTADLYGFMGKLVLGGGATRTAVPPAADAAFNTSNADQRLLASELDLDPAALAAAGFSRLVAASKGPISVQAPVQFASGGKLWLASGQSSLTLDGQAVPGGRISVDAPVSIPGGSVALSASATLDVAAGTRLDTAGRWVNDTAVAGAPRDAQGLPTETQGGNGGNIGLFANQVSLGAEALLDVSAGAWMNTAGVVKQRNAGNITVQAVPENKDTAPAKGALRLGDGVRFEGQGFASGGSLALTGRNVRLGPVAADALADDLSLPADFFQRGGFSRYDIAANVNLSVAANTTIAPRATSWVLGLDAGRVASGRMADVAAPELLDLAGPSRVRSSASLGLRASAQKLGSAGRLLVESGARIQLDPAANLSLTAGRQVTVLGSLSAPAGNLLVGLSTDDTAPFFAERSIWFGAAAQLRAGASLDRIYTDGNGVSTGEVLAGGKLQIGTLAQGQLVAARGFVVAQAGSLFSVDGVSGRGMSFRSASGLTGPLNADGAGGSIEIRAREGLLWAGSLSGRGGGVSADGQLTLALEGGNNAGFANNLAITTRAPVRGVVPTGLAPNAALVDVASGQILGDGSADGIESRRNGEGWIMASAFASGGFGRLNVKSGQALSFGLGSAALSLTATDALVLDAPVLLADTNLALTSGAVGTGRLLSLAAPYLQLGSADALSQAPDAAQSGKAQLQATAGTLDLIGHAATVGFGKVDLLSRGDLRLVGVSASDSLGFATGHATGRWSSVGNLSLTSAQTYPTTLSEFTLAVAAVAGDASTGTLAFAANGNVPGDVLSAAGSLTALAPHLVQGGRVLAPFGAITLGNVDTSVDPIVTADLVYRPGSLTSVAGSGVVPLGTVVNGSVPTASDWQVNLTDGTTVSIKQNPATTSGGSRPERALPAKAIVSQAQVVQAAPGAVLDASGGGSLYAYGFTPGKGGSRDVLAATTAGKPTTFAILPGFKGAVAPVDGDYGSDGGLKPGDSVTLSATAGLPAGTYTLLPAHYALLPGGYAISVAANTRDLPASANTTLADGSLLVSGRLAQAGSGAQDSRSQGFVLQSGTVVRSRSEFDASDANSYFQGKAVAANLAVPELPQDGGRLAFDARGAGRNALVFDATLKLAGSAAGRAGQLEVAAPSLEIVAQRGAGDGNAVPLLADALTALRADRLLIGALRQADGSLAVRAGSVAVDNDATHPLTGTDLVLAATDRLSLGAGAVLQASGKPARSTDDLVVAGPGALLRASGGEAAALQRSLVGNATGSAGTLDIAPGARVSATGALALDASSRLRLDGSLAAAPGASLSLGAPDIQLGDLPADANARPAALNLGTAALASFGGLGRLTLDSHGTAIGTWGDVTLGSPALRQLTLRGAGLQGHGGAVLMQAQALQIEGQTTAADLVAVAGTGSLRLAAGTLSLGSGSFALQAYAQATLDATGLLMATGQQGQVQASGALALSAGAITTAAGASGRFDAAGALVLSSAGHADPGSSVGGVGGLGGNLAFSGASLRSDARVAAPSGTLALASAGDLAIDGGSLSVAGRTQTIGGNLAYAPGGQLQLQGNRVQVAPGAVLDVSATGADAGQLAVQAASSLALDGSLRGAADGVPGGVAPRQGEFSLRTATAGTADDFAAFNQRLNEAGFTAARRLRYAQGDVVLDGQAVVRAQTVEIAVDDGNLRIGGQALIDASGPKGGSIGLYAGQADASGDRGRVTIADSARLVARGTALAGEAAGSAGQGGQVVLSAAQADGSAVAGVAAGASLDLAGGSIDVSGSDASRPGSVLLRTPRLADNSGAAVARLDTLIQGSTAPVLEAVKTYRAATVTALADSATNLDATSAGRMWADAAALGQSATALRQRLGRSDLAVRAGLDIQSLAGATGTGADLLVSVNETALGAADRGWNLADWRFDHQPVNLSLRAAGTLNVLGAISDGFVKPSLGKLAMPDWALAAGESANLRLVGGADLMAAQPGATVAGASGDVHLGFALRTPTSTAPLSATDAPVALLRTGTGRIDIAAGRDVLLDLAKTYTVKSSDPLLNGTPAVYEAALSGGSFKVNVYGASVYTAGSADTAAPVANLAQAALVNAQNPAFGADTKAVSAAAFGRQGGGVSVSAGRDLVGPHNLAADNFYLNADYTPADGSTPAVPATVALLPRTPSPLVNQWQFRQGRGQVDAEGRPVAETLADGSVLSTAWWSRTDQFNGGLATLGGGDLSLSAGRHVTDLHASVATSAYTSAAGTLREQGGGDLSVRAAGHIQGGAFYVQKGSGLIRADGAITAGPASAYVYSGPADARVTPLAPLAPVLALGDASISVVSGGALALSATYNPTQTEQSAVNVGRTTAASFSPFVDGRWDADYRQRYAQFSGFSTYGADSGIALTALGGGLALSNDGVALSTNRTAVEQSESLASGAIPNVLGQRSDTRLLYLMAPPRVSAVALAGDVVSANGFTLAPSASGQLDLLASASVRLSNGPNGALRMLDNDPAAASSAAAPRPPTATDMAVLAGNLGGIAAHTQGGLHAADSGPVRVAAGSGDVVGDPTAAVTLALPKRARIDAGRDILNLGLQVQHTQADDTTRLTAGRDITDTTQAIGASADPSPVAHVVTGGGQVALQAGRHVDLGNGSGLVTRGNLDNPYLADGGAAVRIVAGGAAPDLASYVAFAKRYGAAADIGSSTDLAELVTWLRQRQPDLAASATADQAWGALRSLPEAAQQAYLAAHPALATRLAQRSAALDAALAAGDQDALAGRFFASLVETSHLGRKTADGKVIDSSLKVFDDLIASLFPGRAAGARGDISAFASQVKTEQGGAVDLYAPSGSVYAGLTLGVSGKEKYQQGIFTLRGGAVRSLVARDFLVNQGRVFTLGGGDIALVSQYADIDAGRGAKTAASAPPPLITIDGNGNVKVDVSASISGSGIATLRTRPDQPASNVYAIAPRGVFDAGDAGVRSTGSVEVVAPVVLNANNIVAGGTVSGAAVAVAAPSLGGGVAAPPSASPATDDSTKAATAAAGANPNLSLTVEALGYGPEGDDDDPNAADGKKKRRKNPS